MNTPPRRTDRSSRVVALVILAAIVVPVLYLLINAAVRGPDAINFDTDTPTTVPAPMAPTPGSQGGTEGNSGRSPDSDPDRFAPPGP